MLISQFSDFITKYTQLTAINPNIRLGETFCIYFDLNKTDDKEIFIEEDNEKALKLITKKYILH